MPTRLHITVDAEVCVYDPALDTPDTQIWGKTSDGGSFGIGFIMDELAARGWTCTFFLNVYDTDVWCEEPIATIARTIKARGFDVQLHTHIPLSSMWEGQSPAATVTGTVPAASLKGLSAYSLSDQRRLLREGADRLEHWTGIRPLWHRAGNLCANLDTVRACAAEGFAGDSSYLYGWPQCASLGAGDRLRNELRLLEGIRELPITTFRTLPVLHNYRHLDLDACTDRELIAITRQAARQGVPHIVLLLHSFSFVRRTDQGYVANEENIVKFRTLLRAAEGVKNLEVIALSALNTLHPNPLPLRPGHGKHEGERKDAMAGEGVFDLYSGLFLTYHRAWAHWGRSWKHKVMALAPLIVLLAVVAIWMWLNK